MDRKTAWVRDRDKTAVAAGNTRPDKSILSADTRLLSEEANPSPAAKSAVVAAAEAPVIVGNYRAG